MADTYWQDSGGLAWLVQSGATPDAGWTQITLSEYIDSVAAREVAIAEHKAEVADDGCQARKDAYQDLHSHVPALDLSTVTLITGWAPGDC